jgi:hypothetical protein
MLRVWEMFLYMRTYLYPHADPTYVYLTSFRRLHTYVRPMLHYQNPVTGSGIHTEDI